MFEVSESGTVQTRILVLGVGGAGCNALDHLYDGLESTGWGVTLVAVNTDLPALSRCKVPNKLQIGKSLTKGKGAGGKASIGYQAALERRDELTQLVEEHDLIFIATNLGRGTGTGAAPYIAKLAFDKGKCCVACVGLPDTFGRPYSKDTQSSLAYLERSANSLIVLEQDRLMSFLGRDITMSDTWEYCDNLFGEAIHTVLKVIHNTGLVNVDYADVITVARFRGNAMIAEIEVDTAQEMIPSLVKLFDHAVCRPLDPYTIRGLILDICGPSDKIDLSITEQADFFAVQYLNEEAVEVITGFNFDESLPKVKIMVIATGASIAQPADIEETEQIDNEMADDVSVESQEDQLDAKNSKNSVAERVVLSHIMPTSQIAEKVSNKEPARSTHVDDAVHSVPAHLRRKAK